ncbi:MAG: thiol-disulfide oxidoreductase DCC family protein [Gemmatimonadota bacterium]
MTKGDPYLLIFDGDCGFCRAVVEKVHRWDRHGRVESFPLQDERRLAETGVSREAAERAMYLVAPDGRRWDGADAAAWLLPLLPGGVPFGWLLRFPLVRPIARATYRWVADHRRFMSRITRTEASCAVGEGDLPR